ncbi:MAG: hypothetical protein QOI30_2949 [Mycobacterium sp.]|nr:hypothetical protein [Mycobacterium sp.]
MLSRSVEPACRRRHSSVLSETSGPVSGHDAASPTPRLILVCVYDAPDQQATTTVTRATIHPIANRETGRAPLLATTQTRVGTHGAPDSIAVN